MSIEIGLLLLQDGLMNGAVYVLMAIGIVLVFNVTRIAFISFGDLIAYSSLTLATLQFNEIPGTVWLLATLSAIAIVMETTSLIRADKARRIPIAFCVYVLLPLLPVAATVFLIQFDLPAAVRIALTIALVLPIGPLLYRVVFQPLASSSGLVLLMAAVALHFALAGLALLYFGPEGMRSAPYFEGVVDLGVLVVPAQTIVILGAAIGFSLLLYVFFERTILGKALRATAINRIGARLMGIRTTRMSLLSFLFAAAIAAIAGVLIGPVTTVYYDTGFIVGLKGFLGSVLGGFVNYPLAVLGGLLIGLLESYCSYYSSALKDVIVFGAIVPICIARWYWSYSVDTDDEELEEA